ncbi:hypothetical protein Dimus_000896, partial [Dionaea muscipula]
SQQPNASNPAGGPLIQHNVAEAAAAVQHEAISNSGPLIAQRSRTMQQQSNLIHEPTAAAAHAHAMFSQPLSNRSPLIKQQQSAACERRRTLSISARVQRLTSMKNGNASDVQQISILRNARRTTSDTVLLRFSIDQGNNDGDLKRIQARRRGRFQGISSRRVRSL